MLHLIKLLCLWNNGKKNEQDLGKLLDLLEANVDTYQVSELGSTTDDIDIEPVANAQGVKVIFGSITSSIDRLTMN